MGIAKARVDHFVEGLTAIATLLNERHSVPDRPRRHLSFVSRGSRSGWTWAVVGPPTVYLVECCTLGA